MKNIIIIGLGPHCKRIYIRAVKKYSLKVSIVVDLKSKKREVERYLKDNNINALTVFLPDKYKDSEDFPLEFQNYLALLVKKNNISHAIISTEPKAHYAYLKYFINQRISVLVDKPITAPVHVINSELQSMKIAEDFYYLLELSKKNGVDVVVQCQRRFDKRYQYIIGLIRSYVKEYDLPISHIQISHCDGSWNMPDEFLYRENHPYKYGYGKIFHSGYHFIDLLTLLLSYDCLSYDKKTDSCSITSSHYAPQDQLFVMNDKFFKKIFGSDRFENQRELWRQGKYKQMGELDLLAQIEFFSGSNILTTASLNLLQSGFSRRAWHYLPEDTYKGNGRVRHEHINLHIGPLMNIQVHSYQAYEIKERNNSDICHEAAGGLEHFDIHVYRNVELIGGKPYELIKGCDILGGDLIKDNDFIGFNESARDKCLLQFLDGVNNISTLDKQSFTIDLVTGIYRSLARKRANQNPYIKFNLNKNKYEKENYETQICSRLYS